MSKQEHIDFFMQLVETLIRLRTRTGWSVPSLGAHVYKNKARSWYIVRHNCALKMWKSYDGAFQMYTNKLLYISHSRTTYRLLSFKWKLGRFHWWINFTQIIFSSTVDMTDKCRINLYNGLDQILIHFSVLFYDINVYASRLGWK